MIFVDSSFWIAVRLMRDPHRAQAMELLDANRAVELVTSNHVRGETWTYLNRRAGHGAARDFLERLESSPRTNIQFVSERLEVEALNWLRRHDEREYSFVDATSFVLMRSMRIERALAFDGDFSAAGFVELRP